MNIIRQGDVLLVEQKEIPDGLEEIPPENGRQVIMHGEVTFHAHAFYDQPVRVYKEPKAARPTYLRVVETEAFLRHEEHETAKVPPGIYQIPQQSEYTPEELRRVTD